MARKKWKEAMVDLERDFDEAGRLASILGQAIDGEPARRVMAALAMLVANGIANRVKGASADDCIEGHVEMVRTFLAFGAKLERH